MSTINGEDRSTLRTAWNQYCDALRDEGNRLLEGEAGDAEDPQELAEALRCVARIGIMALQHRMEFNDPDFPVMFRSMDDRYKYGGPDTHINYFFAAVNGDATYRLTVQHHGREFNVNNRAWSRELSPESDGTYRILLGAEEQPGNWIPLDPALRTDSPVPATEYPMARGGVFIRSYYWDWDPDQPLGLFTIERIDDDAPLVPAALSPARLAAQIEGATDVLVKAAPWWIARAARIRTEHQPNTIAPPSQVPPGVVRHPNWMPTGEHAPLNYGVCCWDLAPDEALVIETEVPEADYWSFQLHNAWWESPDNQHRQTSISHAQAVLDADGRFRAVVSHRDPGVPNWLDTGESRRGFIFYRWFRPTSEQPTPTSRLIKLDQVRGHLPENHPHTSSEERRAQLAQRRKEMARRFQR